MAELASPARGAARSPLLEVHQLRTCFRSRGRVVRAVDGVSFALEAGRTLALAGETGCGKTVAALSIMRLVDPPGWIEGGSVLLGGRSLLELDEREMCAVRGGRIAMVFQEPMTSLNPVLTCGQQIAEVVSLHQGLRGKQARQRSLEMLRLVGIPAPEQRLDEYPHQLSGGMRQRVMIGMALSCHPEILIADEPTTALDVTVQAQILDLLRALQGQLGMAMLLITHDLGVIAEMADSVAVMYAGKIVEQAGTERLFAAPCHPYTRGLLAAVPRLDQVRRRLEAIPGTVPDPTDLPAGCRFAPRCSLADARCRAEEPQLAAQAAGHLVACWHAAAGPAPAAAGEPGRPGGAGGASRAGAGAPGGRR